MSRTFKFRVWDTSNKEWSNPCYLEVFHSTGELEHLLSNKNKNRYIIQQYTGLKDKNGVEIYEGDILKWSENKYSKVVFWRGGFYIGNIGGAMLFDALWNQHEIQEKIGNIFENSELL